MRRPLTPYALSTWRKAWHLTVADAASLFGVAHSTWTHWERGERAIPGPVQRLYALITHEVYGQTIRRILDKEVNNGKP